MTLPDLTAGVYRHYKGHLFLVLGYGQDSNHEDRSVVVYVGLELEDARPGPRLRVRTAENFHATVDPATGKTTTGGVPRFTYLGPGWAA